MAWVVLFLAALFEVAWAVGLKYADGFSRPLPSIVVAVCMILSVVLLAAAVRTLPLSVAYAVWTGIGTLGAAIFGMVLFGEPSSLPRLACIGLIAAGVIGLKALAR